MTIYLIYFCLLIISIRPILIQSNQENEINRKCGYADCPTIDPKKLNVHLVPHTHNDVGWLKTVDQYFYGWKNKIQMASVQNILDTTIDALLRYSERRFVYAETAYFWKWWQERDNLVHKKIKFLVNTGQFEIVGGGWTMNDEATTNYQSIIDQFTWGFRIINETLGECGRPKVGWQIDTFGHSKEMASLLSQFGFDGVFLARIDYLDKKQRLKSKHAEMIWVGNDNLKKPSNIFTSIFFKHYTSPNGFCFDMLCEGQDPNDNSTESKKYNFDQLGKMFIKYAKNHAKFYRTNNIIVPMGNDFFYQNAHFDFDIIDKLLKSVNKLSPKINVFYSSPSCYLKAINDQNITWPTKYGDFFPYAANSRTYWTGYFTSRPSLKRFIRIGNNFLQVAKQLASLSNLNNSLSQSLNPLREAIGILQHHDAITGTERQHVADDYAKILDIAIRSAENITNPSLKILSKINNKFHSCLLLNISQCYLTENNDEFFVIVYNSLSREINYYARIPVIKTEYEVYDLAGNVIEHQYVPIFTLIQSIPGRDSGAQNELIFKTLVPPLGFKIYYIKYNIYYNLSKNEKNKSNPSNIELEFSPTGHLETVVYKNGDKISLKQNFLFYNSESRRHVSGAYLFKPQNKNPIPVSENVNLEKFAGPLITEYHQIFNSWVGQIIKVYKDTNFIEFQWVVGPINVNDGFDKNIISRYITNIDNQNVFYTDSNGREMIKRFRNNKKDVTSNYYPVSSKISIRDLGKQIQLSVINDRAQGGSSLKDGEIELMIHRRLLHDDKQGLNEPLNEVAFGSGLVAIGKHYVIVGPLENEYGQSIAAIERFLMLKTIMSPWIFFSSRNNITNLKNINEEFSGLNGRIVKNVQILTLEPWNEDSLLLRLEHVFEENEDQVYSGPTKINIKNLFSTFKIVDVQEMNLGANQLKSSMDRLYWKTDSDDDIEFMEKIEIKNNIMEVELYPMEIKTFIVKIVKI